MFDMTSIAGFFNQVWQGIINFLPGSPFKAIIESLGNLPYLRYLNWFFPVTECIAVLEVWLAVVAVYYVYSALMRFINIL